MLKKSAIIFLILLGLGALLFSHDIKQKNPETIFLTEKSLAEYKIFKQDILEKQSLVIKKNTTNKEEFYTNLAIVEKLCNDPCEVLTERILEKKHSKKSNQEKLLKLENDQYVSAIILDNTDEIQKKILFELSKNSYWNDSNTSFAGMPYTNYLLDKYSLTIQEKLFPLMFIMGFVISFIFIGKLKNAFIVYLPCLFSAGFSLATLKILDGQMNMVTSIIPLIVFTVTLSLSFHLYFSLIELRTIHRVFKIKWAPIFLMMFTTYIGFLSLGWAEITVIREFGLLSSQLVLFTTLYTFLWYYLFAHLIAVETYHAKKSFFPPSLFKKSIPFSIIKILTILGLLAAVLVPKNLEIITDATKYFPKVTKIREKIVEITSTVSGLPIMEISIDLDKDINILNFKKLELIEDGLLELSLSEKYKIVSNNLLIKEVNSEYVGEKKLPANISAYLVLRGQLPISLQESYPVDRKYRITLLGNPIDVKAYMADLKEIENYLNKNSVKFMVNGIHHNLMVSQNVMMDILVKSFLSSAIIIFIFSAFFLKSIKYNAVFIFVSLLPVALTFAVMYFLNFSLNIATVMTFSISLGLVGDSSFHIIYAKKVRFKSFEEYSRAVLSPIVGSGLLLCTCFGIFTFNDFMPIRQFGGILAIIMFLGTITDLYILPSLLYLTTKHYEAYEIELYRDTET